MFIYNLNNRDLKSKHPELYLLTPISSLTLRLTSIPRYVNVSSASFLVERDLLRDSSSLTADAHSVSCCGIDQGVIGLRGYDQMTPFVGQPCNAAPLGFSETRLFVTETAIAVTENRGKTIRGNLQRSSQGHGKTRVAFKTYIEFLWSSDPSLVKRGHLHWSSSASAGHTG